MRRTLTILTVAGALVLGLGLAVPDAHAAAADGFIYGTVKTVNGTSYEGFLRWGDEEAFWGDLFNSTKENDEYAREVPRRERQRRRPIEVFGIKIGVRWDDVDPSRVFVARFGDIARIKVRGSDDADVTMKTGTTFEVSGGSNDVDAEITVYDKGVGEVRLPWRKIDTIDFSPAPADATPYGERLWGRVSAARASFEGYIQWDSQECLSTDILDGDSDDGRLKIEMGQIAAIERRSRRSSTVQLTDGRSLVLSGTNDVDSSIRGILVEDPRYGRVEVSWDGFERVEFGKAPSSGPGYNSFAPLGRLHGTVTADDGRELTGRIVFDIDEAEGWEILHGSADDVEYLIPFALVSQVEPRHRDESRVTLLSGETLRLEDSQDVGENNAGVLVFGSGDGEPEYVPWDEVRRIVFKH